MKTCAPPRESGEFSRAGLGLRARRPSETIPRALEAVTGELSLEAVLCAIPEEFVETLGARAVSVYALASDKRTLELVAQAGFELLVRPTPRLDIGDALPAARAVRQRAMQVMGEPGCASGELDPALELVLLRRTRAEFKARQGWPVAGPAVNTRSGFWETEQERRRPRGR